MSSPYWHSFSSPTASCPVRTYSPPGDAASLTYYTSSCCWKRRAYIGSVTGRTWPTLLCCVVAEGIYLHLSWTPPSVGPWNRWQGLRGQLLTPTAYNTYAPLQAPPKRSNTHTAACPTTVAPSADEVRCCHQQHVCISDCMCGSTKHLMNWIRRLHADCSSGQEPRTRITWILVVWELTYFKYTLLSLTAAPW